MNLSYVVLSRVGVLVQLLDAMSVSHFWETTYFIIAIMWDMRRDSQIFSLSNDPNLSSSCHVCKYWSYLQTVTWMKIHVSYRLIVFFHVFANTNFSLFLFYTIDSISFLKHHTLRLTVLLLFDKLVHSIIILNPLFMHGIKKILSNLSESYRLTFKLH